MNRIEFYDNLNLFKTNSLQHNSEYGKQHYAKIDKYYPDGRARYFWTKAEWDAYQREKQGKEQDQFKKNQAQKKTALNKEAERSNDMSGYDKWKKEQEESKKDIPLKTTADRMQEEINKNYSNKIKEENKKNDYIKNQRADVQKKINEILENNQNGLKKKELYKLDDMIINSVEGKEAINLYENFMNEYNGIYSTDKENEMKQLIEEKIKSVYNFDKSDISSAILSHISGELINKAKEKWRIHNSGKIRDTVIKDNLDRERIRIINKEINEYNAELNRIQPIIDSINNRITIHDDNAAIDNIYNTLAEWRKNEEIDPETGLPLKNYDLNKINSEINYDLLLVNPGYRYEEETPTGNMTEDEVAGYHHNCLLSTIACVLRERGYDVSAGTDLDGVRAWGPSFINEYDNIYTNIDTSITDLSKISNLRKEMEQLPPGTYGDMQVLWDIYNENYSGSKIYFGGHSTFFKVDDKGKLHIYDGQTGRESDWEYYEEFAMLGRYYVLNDAEVDIDYVKKNKMIIY